MLVYIIISTQTYICSFRYGHGLLVYKNQIIKNRILVFICKYVFKLCKNLEIKADAIKSDLKSKPTTDSEMDTHNPTSITTTSTTIEAECHIVITKKYHWIVQDLIKQHLILLEMWSQSISSEFYNQVKESL